MVHDLKSVQEKLVCCHVTIDSILVTMRICWIVSGCHGSMDRSMASLIFFATNLDLPILTKILINDD